MDHSTLSATAQRLMAHVATVTPGEHSAAVLAVERLPFTIKVVGTDEELAKAVKVRHDAYARHVPDFARHLRLPEESDFDTDSVVLLAESKFDGSALGSARIQTNLMGPLHLEDSVELPLWLHTRRLAEVTRLGIGEGRIGHVVKIALIKACFEYCEQNAVEWAVVTGRTPIDRQYEQLLFTDVFPNKDFIKLRHVGNIPHRVMAFDIGTGAARWAAVNHPLLKFFRHTRHPDIDVTGRATPRRSNAPGANDASVDAPLYGFAATR